MSLDFQEAIEKMKPIMRRLMNSAERHWEERRDVPQQGVYILYENGEPIYVGRSNRMRERIREHGAESSDRHSATFAFRLLRLALNEPDGSSGDIEKVHKEEFSRQRERVRAMTFRTVEITDQLEQTLFEIYAILELGTYPKYNDFDTH